MTEAIERKETKIISFRVTHEEYAQIEGVALATGEGPNGWCRNIALTEAPEGSGLTKTDRLLYEEIARVRYLVKRGFRLLLDLRDYRNDLEEDQIDRRGIGRDPLTNCFQDNNGDSPSSPMT